MSKLDILRLFVSILGTQAAGIIGSFFTAPAIETWYNSLVMPVLAPPNWIFAPVWIALYLLMGVAVFLVWRKGVGSIKVKIALAIFVFQLFLNTLWSIIFFGFRSPESALLEILLLWSFILLSMFSFRRVSKTAAWLLAPYILWVSFAIYLNLSIVILN